jgi:hypothetical protein
MSLPHSSQTYKSAVSGNSLAGRFIGEGKFWIEVQRCILSRRVSGRSDCMRPGRRLSQVRPPIHSLVFVARIMPELLDGLARLSRGGVPGHPQGTRQRLSEQRCLSPQNRARASFDSLHAGDAENYRELTGNSAALLK